MPMIARFFATFALAAVAAGPAAAAGTGSARTFVSGHGADSGTCPITTPCRSFAYALTQTASGGEILVLDSAGYGVVTITQAVKIVAPPGIEGSISVPSGTGIAINAGTSDSITLSGLTIDGGGAGTDGIALSQAGELIVNHCVIRGFTHDGMYPQPTSNLRLTILDTIASDNGNNGFDLSPTKPGAILGTIDHSTAINNGYAGIVVYGNNTNNADFVAISNSTASNNGSYGIVANANQGSVFAITYVTVKDSQADNNSGLAAPQIYGTGYAAVALTRVEAFKVNFDSNAQAYTFGDNAIVIFDATNLTKDPLQ